MCGAYADLQECNQQLEVVEKGLNQFLETKKMAFPRYGNTISYVVVYMLQGSMLAGRTLEGAAANQPN